MNTAGNTPYIGWHNSSAEPLKLTYYASSNFTSPVELMKLNPSGNTGTQTTPIPKIELYGRTAIGTDQVSGGSNTDYMLSVDGKVVAKGYVATLSNWADYVFANGYQLPLLSEEKEHNKNKATLIGVPSEKDIITGGNNLAQTDAILLSKIEELYLHIFKLEERIVELEKK